MSPRPRPRWPANAGRGVNSAPAGASFGPSVVHPQPEGRYWAVVGQLLIGAMTGHMRVVHFVAAVRLTCDDAANTYCWRLEKLAIDNRIVFGRETPL